MSIRKIIHIDMDAFYASVEIRERPELKSKPIVVAWEGDRSVICAASYEAREYGLHSAMAVSRAKKLCPHAIYIPPNFPLYKEISSQVRQIFSRYTSLIEPLSLDEAYLDVTQNYQQIPYATQVAELIRQEIYKKTGLTASAGVANSKFLAKIASDWNKPDGIFVIPPHKVKSFLKDLPLNKVPGVGKVTFSKMKKLKLYTMGDISKKSLGELIHHFGSYGYKLYYLAQGQDKRQVVPHRVSKQISSETTFESNLCLEGLKKYIPYLAEKVMISANKKGQFGFCCTLKLKDTHFKTYTRSKTLNSIITTKEELSSIILRLLEELSLDPEFQRKAYRLVGLGVSEFIGAKQMTSQLSLL